jgi:hypothetical protein
VLGEKGKAMQLSRFRVFERLQLGGLWFAIEKLPG